AGDDRPRNINLPVRKEIRMRGQEGSEFVDHRWRRATTETDGTNRPPRRPGTERAIRCAPSTPRRRTAPRKPCADSTCGNESWRVKYSISASLEADTR